MKAETALIGPLVEAEMRRILASRQFASAERLQRFLRFIVAATLEGDTDHLKESVIGVQVFDLAIGFDTQLDPVVRVTARRLRDKLEQFYAENPCDSGIMIQLPKGGYVPEIVPAPVREVAPIAPEAPVVPVATVSPESAPSSPPKRNLRWLVWGAAILGLTIAVLGAWIWTRNRPPVLDRLRPFATGQGRHAHPAFSPNGEILAFDWEAPQDHHVNIYVQRLDASAPLRLTADSADSLCPAWSPDGNQVAFLRNSGPQTFSIVSVPLLGPGEQKKGEIRKAATPWLAESPDGKWFAAAERTVARHNPSIVLISAATGEKRSITTPPLGWRGDSIPVFAPDSLSLAFRRTQSLSGHEDLYSVPITGGEPKRLTFDDRGLEALAFTPDKGLLFASKRESSIRGLWWMPHTGGQMVRLTSALVDVGWPTVSRDGKHLAFTKILFRVNIWRLNADGAGAATPLIDSELPNGSPRFSPDGQRIAFQSDRSGSDEVWVSNRDGANPVRLTDGGGTALGNPRWSPDGRQIAFEWQRSGKAEVFVIASDGGTPRLLVSDPNQNAVPEWSHDGAFVYFTSDRTGRYEVWKIPPGGGPVIQMTRGGGYAPSESRDGAYLYFFRPQNHEIWRMPLNHGRPSGPETRVLGPLSYGDWGNWALADDGIYYIQRGDHTSAIMYQDDRGSPARNIYVMSNPPVFGTGGLDISPDRKTILFAQVDADGSGLFVQ